MNPRRFRLLVLAGMLLLAGCADADRAEGGRDRRMFARVRASRTGITFRNDLPENAARNGFTYEYYYNGAGVAAGDLNGDDLPDLYFTANAGPNRLYLNRGDFRFEDVTERAEVAGRTGGWATGVVMADVNADGRLDIYVSQSGPFAQDDLRRNLLYINQGEQSGTPVFREEAADWGLDDPGLSTQAAFFDYDGDGDLDMYLMNHGVPGYRTIQAMRMRRSPAEVDRLYRNDGTRFVDASESAGLIDTNLGFGLGLSVGDVNNDGRPDVYVANDYGGRDYLYLGWPGGRFEESLAASMGHIPLASMGSDVGDIDGDGWLDVVVLEMAMSSHYARKIAERGTEAAHYVELAHAGQHFQHQSNALQWSRGVMTSGVPLFSEIAQLAGVARTDWSWAPLLADFDNDGRPDLFVSNGTAGAGMNADFDDYRALRLSQAQQTQGRVPDRLLLDLLQDLPRQKVANRVFRNEGDLTFSDRSAQWGFDEASYSHGAVYSDLDRDGDVDLVVNNLQGEAYVYRNDVRETTGAHYLRVRLDGPPGNLFGIGARVSVRNGSGRQVQELQLARGYLSSVEPVLHFGLGDRPLADTLEVVWPDGSVELRTAVPGDGTIALLHSDARQRARRTGTTAPLFDDAVGLIQPLPADRAQQIPADSALQPYPTMRSDIALAVGDLDNDGLDDFVHAGATVEPPRVYMQRPDGSFRGTPLMPDDAAAEPIAATVLDADADGAADIWIVAKSTTNDSTDGRHLLYLNDGAGDFRLTAPAIPAATSAGGVTLAAGDYDADGRVDLFIGSRAIPGAGPAPGSRLFRNERGGFRDVTADIAPALAELRTVTDALWADVDGNGTLDLVVVGEWMPITVLFAEGGRLRDATAIAGLDEFTGWWQSVAAADFDADGDLDIVAGNVGLNYPYRPMADAPFELYVADFDGDGSDDPVPAYHEDGQLYPWYGRTRMGETVAGVIERFPTYDAYARRTVTDILGAEPPNSARRFTAATLATTYFENEADGRFRARPLPPAAQLSAVTGIAPADYDQDGRLDLVIAGNLHRLDSSVPRLDGGVGLFLRGDGSGTFEPVQPHESGLWLGGEVAWLVTLCIGTGGELALVAGLTNGKLHHVRTVPRF